MESDDLPQIDVGHCIAADDDKGLVQVLLGVLDAARRAQGRLLNSIVDLHPKATAIAKVGLDDLGHEVEGDHDFGDALPFEVIENMSHHRL